MRQTRMGNNHILRPMVWQTMVGQAQHRPHQYEHNNPLDHILMAADAVMMSAAHGTSIMQWCIKGGYIAFPGMLDAMVSLMRARAATREQVM